MKSSTLLLVPLVVLSACSKPGITVGEDQQSSILRTVNVVKTGPTKGNVQDDIRGKETWFAYGAIQGQNGTPANGVVSAHRFSNGISTVDGQINIPVAEKDHVYAVWLSMEAQGAPLFVGLLQNISGDPRHALRQELSKDIEGMVHVRITLETDPTPVSPGKTVASGILKPTAR